MDKEDTAKEKEIYHVTVVGDGVNSLLLLFKFFARIVGHSAAMLVDTVHSLLGFVTDIIVIVFVRISSKPEDGEHDYGHGRYETLATVIIGIVLFLAGFEILWNGILSICHLLHGSPLQEPGMLALIATLISVVLKEVPYRYTVFKGRKLDSQAVVVNTWHHRSGALSSIGIAVGIGRAIFLGDRWQVLDPMATVIVSFFIMKMTTKLSVPCVDRLLKKSLSTDAGGEIQKIIPSSLGMSPSHHLYTRRVGSYYAMEVHARTDSNVTLEEARRTAIAIESTLEECFGRGTHVDTHVGPVKEIIRNS